MIMTDILLLGATGYTGRLISEYLSSHPDRLAHNLSLTLAGRSQAKLTDLLDDLPDRTNVSLLHFSSLDTDLSCALNLQNTTLVINTIGPYFTHTHTVADLCARTSTHYLDLSAEPHHAFSLIHNHNTHVTALDTHSLIIPSCGYDSIPSDLATFLSAKALFDMGKQPDKSTTVHLARLGISGGTAATVLSTFSIPRRLFKLSSAPFASSPIVGPKPHPKLKFIYKLFVPGSRSYTGCVFPVSTTNSSVVQRSYGLLELDHIESDNKSGFHYGPHFTYDEFYQVPNALLALLYSSVIFTFMTCLFLKPFRNLLKFLLPSQGSGPPKENLQNGYFAATNFTFAAPSDSDSRTTYAKTILKGKGDPGYLLTSIMISESALSILVPSDSSPSSSFIKAKDFTGPKINPSLPPLAHAGGLLTPSTALGDVLVQRLVKTGKFVIETEVLTVG